MIDRNVQDSSIEANYVDAEVLKSHAQTQNNQKIDAKSILLMDHEGNVQEPT